MADLFIEKAEIFFVDTGYKILKIENINISKGLNFIIGSNGTGKSTLLKSLSSLYPNIQYNGEIFYNNSLYKPMNLSLVEQNPLLSISQELTVIENLQFALNKSFYNLKPLVNKSKRMSIIDLMKEKNIYETFSNSLNIKADKLSGGQQQILAILMRIIRGNKILLLDECTANLDDENKNKILNWLKTLGNEDYLILFVTHQLEATNYSNHIYKIENNTLRSVNESNI